jgi:hypothetical protein
MTTHVFIGIGPANLHRALKIQKINPNDKLVFIDDRIRPDTRDINRERARANIFRFENDEVTAKLLADGISQEDWDPLVYHREFSIERGFQFGDDTVFSNKDFTQIQIRDLQLVLMKTIDRKGREHSNEPVLINQKVGMTPGQTIEDEVLDILKRQANLNLNTQEIQNIKIHVATGALQGNSEKHEIIYPDKVSYNTQFDSSSEDIAALTVTPLHGAATFIIQHPNDLHYLQEFQRSLDLADWGPALKEFGWNLVRPPRIRVFYTNDILYIGTEIPISMKDMPQVEFEKKLTAYTRQIATLVFPNLPVNILPENPHLRTRFPTARGECGEAIRTCPQKQVAWNGTTVTPNRTVYTHGDSRYLPHYQTGSGFVTAFLQNELYAEIYSRNSFKELVDWANSKLAKLPLSQQKTSKALSVDEVQQQYNQLAATMPGTALEAFQQELFLSFSRDIIEQNKQKVGRYFNAIHNQTISLLGKQLDTLIKTYNRHHATKLKIEKFQGKDITPEEIAIELLKTNNVAFLREILPQLLNMDFTDLSDEAILNIRSIHIVDFKRNITLEGYGVLSREELIQELIRSRSTRINLLPPPTPIPTSTQNDNSASIMLTIGAGLFACAGAASIVLGALALASIIAFIIPPLAIALVAGGAVALGLGITGLCFFSKHLSDNKDTSKEDALEPEFSV